MSAQAESSQYRIASVPSINPKKLVSESSASPNNASIPPVAILIKPFPFGYKSIVSVPLTDAASWRFVTCPYRPTTEGQILHHLWSITRSVPTSDTSRVFVTHIFARYAIVVAIVWEIRNRYTCRPWRWTGTLFGGFEGRNYLYLRVLQQIISDMENMGVHVFLVGCILGDSFMRHLHCLNDIEFRIEDYGD